MTTRKHQRKELPTKIKLVKGDRRGEVKGEVLGKGWHRKLLAQEIVGKGNKSKRGRRYVGTKDVERERRRTYKVARNMQWGREMQGYVGEASYKSYQFFRPRRDIPRFLKSSS